MNQHHSHAERAVHREVVHARLVLADDGAEPAHEHIQDKRCTGQEHPAAAPFVEDTRTAPIISVNSATEPMIGHGLSCGT